MAAVSTNKISLWRNTSMPSEFAATSLMAMARSARPTRDSIRLTRARTQNPAHSQTTGKIRAGVSRAKCPSISGLTPNSPLGPPVSGINWVKRTVRMALKPSVAMAR